MFQSSSSRILICLLLLFLVPGKFLSQQASVAVSAKKPGVKRIGVFASATTGEDSIRQQLKELLQGDGTLIEVTTLTNRVETLRQAEAQRNECDFVLETNFEMKPAKKDGGLLGKATSVAKDVNQETGIVKNSQVRIQETDRKTDTLGKLSNTLTPEPKDKVKVTYKLTPSSGKPVLLAQEKEVAAADLSKFLEKFLDDVVKESLK